MRRRLYFLLPDVASATRIANDLLLARIEDRNMRFLARRGTDLGELHEAGYLQKTDLVHGAGVGFALGGVGGLILGLVIVNFPPDGTSPQLVAVLITVLLGAAFGTWVASMVATAVPNSRLQQFQEQIAQGRILLLVDVPYAKVDQIRALLLNRHPEAVWGGQESRIPAFP